MTKPQFSRGQIWKADLEPVRGHEQGGYRPVVILSDDAFSNSPADLVIVVPMTSTAPRVRTHVAVTPQESGLGGPGSILCEQVRTLSHDRLAAKWGNLHPDKMALVEDRLRILLAL